MRIPPGPLKQLVRRYFQRAGSADAEAERIGHYLVEANLAGHDSHGVIRVPSYVSWARAGQVVPNQHLRTVTENDAFAVVDGQFGFGQVIGEEATRLGIAKAAKGGAAVIALRNSGHLGQIGMWALMAADAGQLSLHFVNTSGAGILVAPTGGISRRLSANPIAAGVPVRGGRPIVLDISTSTVAEGKVRVALNKGVPVPDGCLIDPQGRPTNDPKTFYGPPPGAILPFGGYKGYGLGLIAEMLAGALTGGSCSNPKEKRVVNNMLSVYLSPKFFVTEEEFYAEVDRFVAYVKSSEKASPTSEILMPGEPEDRNRRERAAGVELDATTWQQILDTGAALGVTRQEVDALVGATA
jgi:uncharacterized oxidoreductase